MLKLLHFHIGSQLTDIKRIKNAMKEAARVYAKIVQMKVPVDLLDVGGGMAVDYDGSKTAFDSSANYTAQEFANDVVYTIKQVCDDENVPHPTIIQESGRYLSAYHAILVTNVLERDRNRRRGHHAHRDRRRRPAGRHRARRSARDDHGQELPRVLPRRAGAPRRAVHALQPRAHLARRSREGRGALLGRLRARRQVRAAGQVRLGGVRRSAAALAREVSDELLGLPLGARPLGARPALPHRPHPPAQQAADRVRHALRHHVRLGRRRRQVRRSARRQAGAGAALARSRTSPTTSPSCSSAPTRR